MQTSEMDLGFALGWSDQTVRSRLNNNAGAGVGVNAASRVNMSFVASEPLLELVWSPGKGLCLKCADYSLTNKNSSLLWDVGQTNMVLSSSDSVQFSGTNDNRPLNEGKLNASQAEFERHCEAAKDGKLAKSPWSSGDPVFGSPNGLHAGTDGNNKEANPVDRVSVVHSNQEQEYRKFNEGSEAIADQENQRTTSESNLPSLVIGHSKLALHNEDSKHKMETHGSPIPLLPEKLDSASENKGKGKEKALSDRETNKRTSKNDNDDDDSNESMESCSSAILFSKGHKRLRLEQELSVGSKRIKKQVQESPFMIWIANMVKGSPKPNQEMGPALALTLDHPNRGLDCDEEIITRNKTHKPESINTGFQTVFESIHSQKAKVCETRILNEDCPLMGSKEDKTCCDIIVCNTKKPQMGTGCSSNSIWHGKMISEKQILCSEEIQKPKVPLCRKQILDSSKGMFDAISRLRLSRTDILRWKKSRIPLSNLDGFFLRLRLGKSQGVGGTGYYVARTNGMQREDSPKNSKNPISVNIGGINCLVESQYVSNHDFLEAELMAWWEITSKSGKIPSEADLKSKFEERKKLGF